MVVWGALLFIFSGMNSTSNYKVSLGPIARTLLYEDSEGTIRFGFDFDTSEGENAVILERPVSNSQQSVENEQLRQAKQSRITLAFERTKQYLLSQGHQVKIWPDEFEK